MEEGKIKFRSACRSLLQKAVRRGSGHLTQKAASCLEEIGDFDWLTKRTAIITFEENWPLGAELGRISTPENTSLALMRATRSVKDKGATGLGTLALALSAGDLSVLSGESKDHPIIVVAEAIKRPSDFWQWAANKCSQECQRMLVETAHRAYQRGGWPWDRAFMQAAAYLAVTEGVPSAHLSQQHEEAFPLWVALDKHTPQGKQAIHEAAWQFSISWQQLAWVSFYCESALTNESTTSSWWLKEIQWRLGQVSLTYDQAQTLWDRVRPVLIGMLEFETDALERYINLPRQAGQHQLDFLNEALYRSKTNTAPVIATHTDQTGQPDGNSASLEPIQLELF